MAALQCSVEAGAVVWVGTFIDLQRRAPLDSSLSPQGAEYVDVSIINDKCSSVCDFISGCLDNCGVEPQGSCLLRSLSTAGVYK